MSSHNHDHNHSHVHTNNKKVLLFSFIIIAIFMVVEIIGGFVANSLALLSDGLHMFSDAISLGVALVAFIYAEKHATLNKTFGYKRFEILAALFNGVTLFVIGIMIIIEAIKRMFNPIEVQSTEMFIISVIGLIVNVIVALMFKGAILRQYQYAWRFTCLRDRWVLKEQSLLLSSFGFGDLLGDQ